MGTCICLQFLQAYIIKSLEDLDLTNKMVTIFYMMVKL